MLCFFDHESKKSKGSKFGMPFPYKLSKNIDDELCFLWFEYQNPHNKFIVISFENDAISLLKLIKLIQRREKNKCLYNEDAVRQLPAGIFTNVL